MVVHRAFRYTGRSVQEAEVAYKDTVFLETSKQRAEMNRRRCDLIKVFESLDGIELPVVNSL